jgi:broad specificity phosphatase PhoE
LTSRAASRLRNWPSAPPLTNSARCGAARCCAPAKPPTPSPRAHSAELFDAFVACDPTFAFPGGESFSQQEDRVSDALEEIEASAQLPALVVCHGMVIRAALYRRSGNQMSGVERVANGALVPLPR